MRYEIEMHMKVYDNDYGAALTVSPDADGLKCVELRTVSEADIEYFGKVRLVVTPALAMKLAEALQRVAAEVEKAA